MSASNVIVCKFVVGVPVTIVGCVLKLRHPRRDPMMYIFILSGSLVWSLFCV